MKNPTTLFSVLVALVFTANLAQAQWSAGPRGGVNLPNEDIHPPAGGMAAPKPIVGAAVRYRLTPWAAVEVQPQYIIKGKTMGKPFFAADAESWVTPDLVYIEMPILIAIGTSYERFGVEGFVGVAPARLLSASVRYQHWDGATGGLVDDEERDISQRVDDFDLTIDFGLGISCEIAPEIRLVADVRKSVGVVDVMAEPRDAQDVYPWSQDSYYRSRDVKFVGGVMFGF